jgi:hypothetical protein
VAALHWNVYCIILRTAQSFDLDFDLIVSDLAPVDLVIDARRWWWHMGRERPDAGPKVVIISPEPAEDVRKCMAMRPPAAQLSSTKRSADRQCAGASEIVTFEGPRSRAFFQDEHAALRLFGGDESSWLDDVGPHGVAMQQDGPAGALRRRRDEIAEAHSSKQDGARPRPFCRFGAFARSVTSSMKRGYV